MLAGAARVAPTVKEVYGTAQLVARSVRSCQGTNTVPTGRVIKTKDDLPPSSRPGCVEVRLDAGPLSGPSLAD